MPRTKKSRSKSNGYRITCSNETASDDELYGRSASGCGSGHGSPAMTRHYTHIGRKRLRAGQFTISFWQGTLKGKSMVEVISPLGAPNNTHDDDTQWGYWDKVVRPNSGTDSYLIINF